MRYYAQTAMPGFAAAGGFAGLYTYDIRVYGGNTFGRLCREARALNLKCAPSVGPGFDSFRATGDPSVKPRRNGATYDAMWHAALAAQADFVTITSFNEWNEGTPIEPAATAPRTGYLSYAGTYGVRDRSAAYAYLARTAYWTGVAAAAPPARISTTSATPRAAGPLAPVRPLVQRAGERPAVAQAERVILAELSEERDHQRADPITALRPCAGQLREQGVECPLVVAGADGLRDRLAVEQRVGRGGARRTRRGTRRQRPAAGRRRTPSRRGRSGKPSPLEC